MTETYSQFGQDLFVIDILHGKTGGKFLDFGCNVPKITNNTYLLEKKYGFSGLSFDIDQKSVNEWKNSDRNCNNVYCNDLTKMDIDSVLDQFYKGDVIDYFSFDLEPPLVTLQVLKNINFDKHKFGIITFEHDFYRGYDTVKPSREIFLRHGYKKITKEHMMKYTNRLIWLVEDWWINPNFIDIEDKYLDNEIEDLTKNDIPSNLSLY